MKIELPLDNATMELLEEAAIRAKTDLDNFIRDVLISEAGVEYARQQCEDAKTC